MLVATAEYDDCEFTVIPDEVFEKIGSQSEGSSSLVQEIARMGLQSVVVSLSNMR